MMADSHLSCTWIHDLDPDLIFDLEHGPRLSLRTWYFVPPPLPAWQWQRVRPSLGDATDFIYPDLTNWALAATQDVPS